jgi:hypothetical protein
MHANTDSEGMATDLLPDNQEDREVYLRDHRATNFIEVVSNARRDSVDTVIMTVSGFARKPDVLYVALDYAYHGGIAVTMAPDNPRDEGNSRCQWLSTSSRPKASALARLVSLRRIVFRLKPLRVWPSEPDAGLA